MRALETFLMIGQCSQREWIDLPDVLVGNRATPTGNKNELPAMEPKRGIDHPTPPTERRICGTRKFS